MNYHNAKSILKKYDTRLLTKTPKGVGSAIIQKDDRWIIQVFVEERTNAHRWLEKLQQIDDLGIEVVETGKIEALAIDRKIKHRPAFGGISVGHKLITAGTIGSQVWNIEQNKEYILSNNHILANRNRAEIGDAIYQPGCFSEDTKVMTMNGLKTFYDLGKHDQIMTLNTNTGEIEYQSPLKIHQHEYTGEMVNFQGQMYDFLVTPNHQLLVLAEYKNEKRPQIIIAEEFVKGHRKIYDDAINLQKKLGNKYIQIGQRLGINKHTIKGWLTYGKKPSLKTNNWQFLKTGKWNCKDKEIFDIASFSNSFDMDIWLCFFGWYISEGCLGGHYAEKRGDYKVIIRQKNEKNLKEIQYIIKKLGFIPNVRWNHGSVTFCSKKMHDYLKQFGHAENKYIPEEFKQLPVKKLKILLRSLIKGDGSERNGGFRYFTVSRRLAEDIAEIGIKCGFGVSLQKEKRDKNKDIFKIGLSARNLTPRITKKPKIINYAGMIYDVTVPNGTLMVERNGKFSWSGNSYDGGTASDTIAHLSKFKEILFNNSAGPYNYIDCAIAEIDDPAQLTAEIAEIPMQGAGEPKLDVIIGLPVKKSGRTSAVTYSKIESFSGVIAVSYRESGVAYFDDQIITGRMASGGDSGSLLLSEDNRPVGLLFAGSDFITVHNRIGNIVNYLGIVFPMENLKILTGLYEIEEYQKMLVGKYDILKFEKQLVALYNNGQSPHLIYNLHQLQKIAYFDDGIQQVYELQTDIDATPTRTWNWDETLGIYRGFKPIHDKQNLTFYGKYFAIIGLYINRPDEGYIGLFGKLYNPGLDKIILKDFDITGMQYVGGLSGSIYSKPDNAPSVSNCICEGKITGKADCIGGMVGELEQGGVIEKSSFDGIILNDEGSTIGGFIGLIRGQDTIVKNCRAQGVIDGVSDSVAGFCGYVGPAAICENCFCSVYLTRPIVPDCHPKGFADGFTNGIISCYWDSDVGGDLALIDDYARTTEQMKRSETFIDWDFDTCWMLMQYQDYPRIRHGIYWIDVVERLGFKDIINAVKLTGIRHELFEIVDYYQFINLRDKLTENIGLKDIIHNYLEYFVKTHNTIGFSDLLKINVYSQRFLTPKIGLKDTITFLNWTQFLKQNKAFLVERYFCYLEGPGGLPPIELPISSFQGRRRINESTYLGVIVSDVGYYQQIVDRSGGTISIYMGYELFGEVYLKQMILQAKLENIYYHEGATNQSIQLVGHKTYKFSPKTVKIENVNYKRISNGLITIRCPVPDLFLNPGDIVQAVDEIFECGFITYAVSDEIQWMEVTEA